MRVLRMALAQCAPGLGATTTNAKMHLDWIARARASRASVVIFPELSLTGYYVKDLANDIACSAGGPELAQIAEASADIDIVAGFVERSSDGRLYIASGYWSGGTLVHTHRKVYLPTYGIFDDGRYFAPGRQFETFKTTMGQTGIAICEDLWHVSTPYLYALKGATVLVVPAASPGRGIAEGGDLGTASSCRLLNRFCAQYLTMFVIYVNRVGHEDGISFWGGSEVIAPDGTVIARASQFEEELLIADIDIEQTYRERLRNPLLRDERTDIVSRDLAESLGTRRVGSIE